MKAHLSSRAPAAIRRSHVEHFDVAIREIDPERNGPSIENEDMEQSASFIRFGKLDQSIGRFLQPQKLPPESLATCLRQAVDLLNHRPGDQQRVAFHFAASSASIIRRNSSPLHQWLGSLSSINSAARRRNSASSCLLRPSASNRPIKSLRSCSGKAAASVTICSMLMPADYPRLLRKQGRPKADAAHGFPGSTPVPGVGFGVPPKRTFQDVPFRLRAHFPNHVSQSSSPRDAKTNARDERAPRIIPFA